MTKEERNSVIDEFVDALKNTKLECEQLNKDTVNALQMTLPLIADDIAESLKSKTITSKELKQEPKTDLKPLFCEECGITDMQPLYMQRFCRFCGARMSEVKE